MIVVGVMLLAVGVWAALTAAFSRGDSIVVRPTRAEAFARVARQLTVALGVSVAEATEKLERALAGIGGLNRRIADLPPTGRSRG